jgi:hypothetical protein
LIISVIGLRFALNFGNANHVLWQGKRAAAAIAATVENLSAGFRPYTMDGWPTSIRPILQGAQRCHGTALVVDDTDLTAG